MIRALPAGRSPGATALGVVGAIFLSVGLAGCPGSLDPAVAMAVRAGSGGTSGTDGGQTSCDTTAAMAVIAKYSCNQSGCHAATSPASGFDMATAGWETHLVGGNPNSMSLSCGSNGPYLVPGVQPAMGLFLGKISASPPCGVRMPFGSTTGVAAADVACLQSWANMLVAAAGTGTGTDGGGGQ